MAENERTTAQQPPPPSDKALNGFYFTFKENIHTIEPELCQLYDRIFMCRRYYDAVDLTIDGHYTMLRRRYMNTHRRLYLDTGIGNEDINIFKAIFIKTLEDGVMFRHMMIDMLESNGLPRKLIEAKVRYYIGQPEARLARHSGLRSVLWYIHEACISQWSPTFQAMWTADCLLFGEMRCCSANIIGMHALLLGVMMGVTQLHKYFPPELRKHKTFKNPHFAEYFKFIGLSGPAVVPFKYNRDDPLPYTAGDPL